MDKPVVRISVRNLVEFILRSGDLDNRGGSSDREAMQKGSRLHRKYRAGWEAITERRSLLNIKQNMKM